MITRMPRTPRRRRRQLALLVASATTIAVVLTACAADPEPQPTGGNAAAQVTVEEEVPYRSVDGEDLLLDACLPPAGEEPSAAIILLHGGGFERGDRNSSGMKALCREMADYGIAGFNIDYRLAPESTFPAQVDDVSAAIQWLREPDQATRFAIDPERIGVFGSSAGAIMAAWIGSAGDGSLTTGSRVAAVVALSPAVDLTESGLGLGRPSEPAVELILQYLGCADITQCPQSVDASPISAVDGSDPPFFLAISEEELVPIQQAEAMRDALKDAGVPVNLQTRKGDRHAIRLLDTPMRADIREFLEKNLVGSG